ncbi:hypothetical protein MIND_01165400 [Mycena indigotica]|uniref:Uncharacterized protein n=1 Tax=Mycena indigotica TaxID=2126181 RepID=A0A8H6S595_9AGAR|nr:uncharacterized protein MIND_01165400 [Mycena indigotica]KAF7292672.1 hypothetical protein MIND_01165400 [Mycena indigotica]
MNKKRKRTGVSTGYSVSYGVGSRTKISANKMLTQRESDRRRQAQLLSSLSYTQRQELIGAGNYDIEMGEAPDYYDAADEQPQSWQPLNEQEVEALRHLPPGEEGYFNSNEGKEAAFHEILAKCQPKRADLRTRNMRVQEMINAWQQSMESLTDAYLDFKLHGPPDTDPQVASWSVEIIGFDEFGPHQFSHIEGARYVNQSLLRHGYIGAAPIRVTRAFPIRTLEIYRQIHRVCPRYTIDTWSKTLTNLHEKARISNLTEQLSTAYDAYLELLRHVEILNGSGRLFALLKLVDPSYRPGNVRADDRTSNSFRHLSSEEVDVFKDEVVNSKKAKPASVDPASTMESPPMPGSSSQAPEVPVTPDPALPVDDADTVWLDELELTPEELDDVGKSVNVCVERWKAAGPEARKRMFALFAISGIFLTWGINEIPTGYGQGVARLQIDEHFKFHDLDKHAASGKFIFDNYRQAVEKLAFDRGQLELIEQELGTTPADYEQDHQNERQYFAGLRSEPADIKEKADYIELLLKLNLTKQDSDDAAIKHRKLDRVLDDDDYDEKAIKRIKTRYRTTWTRYQNAQEATLRFEEEHDISTRWTVNSPEYQSAALIMTEREYHTALSELERLTVARLLELTKLDMSGLAYKLRDKLNSSLRTRSDAVRRALVRYNAAAARLNPPRPQIGWKEVNDLATLAEFDLLRETRSDVRLQPWTQPSRRQARTLYFGIKRAREEIRRLNVEIRRLITYLLDEHFDFYRAIAQHLITNPALAGELSRRWEHATQLSASICWQIRKCSRLIGFSGSLFPGTRVGRQQAKNDGLPLPSWLGQELGIIQTEVSYEEVSDDIPVGTDDEEMRATDGLEVVNEIDLDEDDLGRLMNHLSTYDDV